MIAIFIIIAPIAVIVGGICGIITFPTYFRQRRWEKKVKDKYLTEAKKINHEGHRQRVYLWLQSNLAKAEYMDNPNTFFKVYNDKVSEIGEDLIYELTKKYENEYKSRSKQNTKAVQH